MKILIVDDDPALLGMMHKMLTHRGHQVIVCPTPYGVSAHVMRDPPDAIVLDVMMPGLNGSALAALIAKLNVEPKPVVILWSAMDEPQLKKTAQEAGGLASISKTLRPSEIAERIEKHVASARGGQ